MDMKGTICNYSFQDMLLCHCAKKSCSLTEVAKYISPITKSVKNSVFFYLQSVLFSLYIRLYQNQIMANFELICTHVAGTPRCSLPVHLYMSTFLMHLFEPLKYKLHYGTQLITY